MEQTAFLARRPPRSDSRDSWEVAARATDISVGQRVRIASGILAGLEGVVTSLAASGNCLLEIDEWTPGVLLSIRAQQLVPAD